MVEDISEIENITVSNLPGALSIYSNTYDKLSNQYHVMKMLNSQRLKSNWNQPVRDNNVPSFFDSFIIPDVE